MDMNTMTLISDKSSDHHIESHRSHELSLMLSHRRSFMRQHETDNVLDRLDLYGSHRVWENKEDLHDYLANSGLIVSSEEIQACETWAWYTELMKTSGEWHDNDSADPSKDLPSYMEEELNWQEMESDADKWLEEMFYHRLSALNMNGPSQNPMELSDRDLEDERFPTWEDTPQEIPSHIIKSQFGIETYDAPCSFQSISPLEVRWAICHIIEVVYNEKKHLRHFIGKWDGGEIFFTKTLGSQIVKAQQRLHRDVKARAKDPMHPEDTCSDFESFRVSPDPTKWFYVDVIQRPTDDSYPWRATWIH